jgi:hypothetical protein
MGTLGLVVWAVRILCLGIAGWARVEEVCRGVWVYGGKDFIEVT